MTTKALRELLDCIDDGELVRCSMGDHAQHDMTQRGAEALAAGWAVVRVPDELLAAAGTLVALHDAEAGAVSTSTVSEAVDRLAAAAAAMREKAIA